MSSSFLLNSWGVAPKPWHHLRGGVKWGRVITSCLPHLNSRDNHPLPTTGHLLTPVCHGLPVCAHPNSALWSGALQLGVLWPRIIFCIDICWCLNCFPLSSPVKEGIRDWLSSVGAVGSWTGAQCWPWRQKKCPRRQEKCPWPCERGLAPGTCSAQPWPWGGFYDLSQGTAFLLSSCS